jgi:hypothetical protein
MPENTPVRRLGDFELIRELGSGVPSAIFFI